MSNKKCLCNTCKNEIPLFLYDMERYAYKISNKVFCSYSCMQKYKSKNKGYRSRNYQRFIFEYR